MFLRLLLVTVVTACLFHQSEALFNKIRAGRMHARMHHLKNVHASLKGAAVKRAMVEARDGSDGYSWGSTPWWEQDSSEEPWPSDWSFNWGSSDFWWSWSDFSWYSYDFSDWYDYNWYGSSGYDYSYWEPCPIHECWFAGEYSAYLDCVEGNLTSANPELCENCDINDITWALFEVNRDIEQDDPFAMGSEACFNCTGLVYELDTSYTSDDPTWSCEQTAKINAAEACWRDVPAEQDTCGPFLIMPPDLMIQAARYEVEGCPVSDVAARCEDLAGSNSYWDYSGMMQCAVQRLSLNKVMDCVTESFPAIPECNRDEVYSLASDIYTALSETLDELCVTEQNGKDLFKSMCYDNVCSAAGADEKKEKLMKRKALESRRKKVTRGKKQNKQNKKSRGRKQRGH